jgi:glycosyltransferase involved in cell wall biosynthesis
MGGEDTTFEQEVELLRETEQVKSLVFKNYPGWRGAIQFVFSIWNFSAAFKIIRAIREFQPEVIHVHNFHYAIGPLIIRTARKKNIPVVLTVQNFRLLCPSGTLYYKGHLFLDSLNAAFPWKAVVRFIMTRWLKPFGWPLLFGF